MKRKKINWSNVFKALLFLVSSLESLYLLYMLTIHSIISNTLLGLSWFGVIAILMSCGTALSIFLDFKEQMKKMSTTRNSQHLKKRYVR